MSIVRPSRCLVAPAGAGDIQHQLTPVLAADSQSGHGHS